MVTVVVDDMVVVVVAVVHMAHLAGHAACIFRDIPMSQAVSGSHCSVPTSAQ